MGLFLLTGKRSRKNKPVWYESNVPLYAAGKDGVNKGLCNDEDNGDDDDCVHIDDAELYMQYCCLSWWWLKEIYTGIVLQFHKCKYR